MVRLTRMISLATALAVAGTSAMAQGTIKIGEINSYKAQPAFLEPYKKGWELAVEQINAAGGINGAKLEVISRDDNATPGDAVRVAEELASRENVALLTGSFLSHIGLAISDFAKQRKMLFVAAEPLTDKIVWENGHKYTYRLRASTYMQTSMLVADAAKLKKKRWALVYPELRIRHLGDCLVQGTDQGGATGCRVCHRAGDAARQDRRRRGGAGRRRRQAGRDLQRHLRCRSGEVRARGPDARHL